MSTEPSQFFHFKPYLCAALCANCRHDFEPKQRKRSTLNMKLVIGILVALALVVALAVSINLISHSPANAFQGAQPPAEPTGLLVSTTAGSLDVSVDWDDVEGANEYRLRWRVAGPDQELNEGITTTSSEAVITVSGYGEWVVRVEGATTPAAGRDRRGDLLSRLRPLLNPRLHPRPRPLRHPRLRLLPNLNRPPSPLVCRYPPLPVRWMCRQTGTTFKEPMNTGCAGGCKARAIR